METLWLHVRAPFAAFRPLQAGVLRTTLPMMPPSTAWGLALNLAGIEMRGPLTEGTTTIRDDAPPLCIALGSIGEPTKSSLYQQLHSYPVGNEGKERAVRCFGAKYHIVPVRREILVDFEAVIGIRTNDSSLLGRIVDGIGGKGAGTRYGLPLGVSPILITPRT